MKESFTPIRPWDQSGRANVWVDIGEHPVHTQKIPMGKYQSGQLGQTVNLLTYVFTGSNPVFPTLLEVRFGDLRGVILGS